MLKIGKVFIDLLDPDHWYQNHPLKSVFQTEEAHLEFTTQRHSPEAVTDRQTRSGQSLCTADTCEATFLLFYTLPVWTVMYLIQCLIQALETSCEKGFAMCCPVYLLEWEEDICKTTDCVASSPSQNSSVCKEFMDSCASGAGENHRPHLGSSQCLNLQSHHIGV